MVLGCSSLQQSLACEVFNSANVQAFKAHPSGVHDNAFPYNNLRDMCHGLRASRSRSSLLLCGWGCVHSFGSLAAWSVVCLIVRLCGFDIYLFGRYVPIILFPF